MKTRERIVHFYDLVIRSHTRVPGITSPSCASLVDVLLALKKQASLPIEINKASLTRLDDWNYDKSLKIHELLFNRADTAASDVSFRNTRSGNLRKGNKLKEEGIELSMHALVRPSSKEKTTALIVMTMGAGISYVTITNVLRQLSRQAAREKENYSLFNFPHPSGEKDNNGQPVTYKVGYDFECLAHKGLVLEQALSTGSFVEMELIQHVVSKFDQGGNLQTKEKSLLVKAGEPSAVTFARLKNALVWQQKNTTDARYDEARIRFKSPNGRQQDARLAINDLDAAFTKKEKIEFDSDMQDQDSKLNPAIIAKLKDLIQDS